MFLKSVKTQGMKNRKTLKNLISFVLKIYLNDAILPPAPLQEENGQLK